MNYSDLQGSLGVSLGGVGSGIANINTLYNGGDRRPMRERLQERHDQNVAIIAQRTAENDAITATLADLDAHPFVERIQDAVRKLLGA